MNSRIPVFRVLPWLVLAFLIHAGSELSPIVAQNAAPLRAVSVEEEPAAVARPPRTSTGEVRENLRLKPGDIVSVNVFGEESLSGAFPVGPGGEIVFPLLGSLKAAGLTTDVIGSDIKSRLETDYIRSAQVSVAIAEEAKLAPNTVTVIGQVMRPGQVAFEREIAMDLFTAVSSAGGLTERADRFKVELKRRDGDDFRTQILDLEGDRALKLQDKDTIIVHAMPEKIVAEKVVQTITVIGEVKNPGQIPLKDNQPIDIITAIATAGGFTPIARPSKVNVRRPNPAGGVDTFEVNVSKMQKDNTQPFMLLPNDSVNVPQAIF
jgi:polysaccharide export outer membrane protein